MSGYLQYLPNQHYLNLIDRYNNSSHVVVYSESKNVYESFDAFRDQGYQVILDGDMSQVWKGLMASDVIILSRSSFSLVPAILSKGAVVYTPFWHQPLPRWTVVDNKLMNKTHVDWNNSRTRVPRQKRRTSRTVLPTSNG
jgi:hypothetical protein